jgi:hypothetical protein
MSNVRPHRTDLAVDANPSKASLHPGDPYNRDQRPQKDMSNLATFILRSPNHALEGAGLHDATLLSVALDWEKAEVQVLVLLLGGIPATLRFHEVNAVVLPRDQPWGPSNSINEAKQLSVGKYLVQMQSGDALHFNAASWSLSITASPSEA